MLTLTPSALKAVRRFIMDSNGFTFVNPNATQSCGCGKSFSA